MNFAVAVLKIRLTNLYGKDYQTLWKQAVLLEIEVVVPKGIQTAEVSENLLPIPCPLQKAEQKDEGPAASGNYRTQDRKLVNQLSSSRKPRTPHLES